MLSYAIIFLIIAIIQSTLQEEEETDKKLTALAKSSINLAAAK